MNYTLVPMDRSHLAGVAELERLCFSTPWNEAMLEEELYNDTASFIVAEGEDGSVLGYAGLHVILDEGYIDNVAVRPSCRRMGIADQLLNVFIRFGQANLAFLTLEVRPSNTPAVALYQKHGFQEAGRRPNYYDNPKEDALLLTREFQR
ncbi:MAG: ribosomal protein S18-alanine N-acetyltransferase [Ruminiclostridium sp.]|nr:ribosomal protein S18-alanine N-acetyltransferase [Ruminiclostridium sp.]